VTARPRRPIVPDPAADEALPPELLAIVEALAEVQARRDYAARQITPPRPA
jgi:hypothetical protein